MEFYEMGWHFKKYTYLHSCQEFDRKIDVIFMAVL